VLFTTVIAPVSVPNQSWNAFVDSPVEFVITQTRMSLTVLEPVRVKLSPMETVLRAGVSPRDVASICPTGVVQVGGGQATVEQEEAGMRRHSQYGNAYRAGGAQPS